jgi:nucleoside phosphorylase
MLLIAAAVEAELEPLVKGYDFEAFRGPGLYHHRRRPVLAAAVGIGLVDFSAGLSPLLNQHGISRALLTGSCGVYPGFRERWPIGSLVRPDRVTLGDPAEACRQAYFPAPLERECRFEEEPDFGPEPEFGGHCLTLAAITSCDHAARRLEAFYQAAFEQMEAFAFARLCRSHGVPAAGLFAVVNEVGAQAHRQWRAQARAGAEQCAAVLGRGLGLE